MTGKLLSTLGLALAASIATPACLVSGTGAMGVSTTPVVYQEPPQDQVEQVSSRPGFVWIRGRWDWQGNQWSWVGGHWERERAGYGWEAGRWERRGNEYHWIEGRWSEASVHVDSSHAGGGVVVTSGGGDGYDGGSVHVDGPGGSVHVDSSHSGGGVVVTSGAYPTAAPPAVRIENYGSPRSGFVWVSGRWDWRNSAWAWIDGHWERERANQMWIAGRWELQGSYYVWIDGHWGAAAGGVEVRDHRH